MVVDVKLIKLIVQLGPRSHKYCWGIFRIFKPSPISKKTGSPLFLDTATLSQENPGIKRSNCIMLCQLIYATVNFNQESVKRSIFWTLTSRDLLKNHVANWNPMASFGAFWYTGYLQGILFKDAYLETFPLFFFFFFFFVWGNYTTSLNWVCFVLFCLFVCFFF